jgi:hypothetical protein
MNDRKRQLRKLLEGYRDRAAEITLEMPELEALVSRHDEGGAAVAERPAPVAERSAPVAERPAPVAERPAPVAERPAPVAERPAPAAERELEIESLPVAPRRAAPVEIEEEYDESRGYARAAWLAAALVAAIGGGWWGVSTRLHNRNIHRVLPLTLTSSVGLARHGAVIYSYDRTRKLMGAIDPATGSLVSLKSFPNSLASSLASSPDKLWSADTSGVLYEHSFNDDYTVRRTFANADHRPCALHWDGAHLWVADARTNSIYEYMVGASLVPARQFTLPTGMVPVGLHVEKGLLWVLDAATRTIYRYRVRALLEPVDSLSLQPWIAAPRKPTGMVLDEKALWISVDGQPELHRFDLSLLPWRADS